jgi:hypothetical protein
MCSPGDPDSGFECEGTENPPLSPSSKQYSRWTARILWMGGGVVYGEGYRILDYV